MSPQTFDVAELIEKDEVLSVKLKDGTECQSVIVTPKVRRELREIDRGLLAATSKLRLAQREDTKDDPDLEKLSDSLDVIDDVDDAVYSKLRLLLVVNGTDEHPAIEQVTSMGDKLADKLYRRLTQDAEGNGSTPVPPSPMETTTTN